MTTKKLNNIIAITYLVAWFLCAGFSLDIAIMCLVTGEPYYTYFYWKSLIGGSIWLIPLIVFLIYSKKYKEKMRKEIEIDVLEKELNKITK